jgi:GT2 family glycosyltransferase
MGQLDKNLNFIRESNQKLNENSYISGWCIASSREIFNKIDMNGDGQIFNENYPFYFNDTDLSFRCRRLGIPLDIVDLPITHFGKISANQMNIRKLYLEGRKTFLKDWKKNDIAK